MAVSRLVDGNGGTSVLEAACQLLRRTLEARNKNTFPQLTRSVRVGVL